MNKFKSIKESKNTKWLSLNIIKRLSYFELKAMNLKKYELLSELINPIIYLVCFGVGVGSAMGNTITYNGNNISYVQYVVPGVLCMFGVDFFTHSLYRTVIDKQWGLLGYKLMHGASPLTYIFSSMFPSYFKYCIKCILVVIVSSVFFSFRASFLGFVLFLSLSIISILFWTTLGILFGLIVKNYQQRDFLASIMVTPIIFSAPIFYSVDSIPYLLKIIVQINPLTHIVMGCRKLILLDFSGTYISIYIIVAFLAIFMALCIKKIREAELNPVRF